MLALCLSLMLSSTYYTQNYAGIIGLSLSIMLTDFTYYSQNNYYAWFNAYGIP